MEIFKLLFLQVLIFILAIACVMLDRDAMAWIIMNCSILIGVVGQIPSWYRKKYLIIGMGIAYLKASLTLFLAWGWWNLTYSSEMSGEHTEFFWLMSPFLLVFGFFETSIINVLNRKG